MARQETALEFWVCGCICLVFSALAEYAFILWNMVRLKRKHRTRDLLNIGGFLNVEKQFQYCVLPYKDPTKTNRSFIVYHCCEDWLKQAEG